MTSDDRTARPPANPTDASRESPQTRALRRAKPGTSDVADLDHGHDDGVLDSIGKAITAPVKDAAQEDDV
jgi:hypothetical protein